MPRLLRRIAQAPKLRHVFFILPLLILTVSAHAQHYTSIVVFGDSLSDTGNVADLTQVQYGVRIPGPMADYTDGRFTDGDDTVPRAQQYYGVWVEQLAAMLPSRPIITNSLEGGSNYAYGFAYTGRRTSVLTLAPEVSVDVDNIGRQVTDYLATHPVINDRTLFVVWGGANDLLTPTSGDDIVKAAANETHDVARLIDAGAREFLILNLPPLGAIPRLNKTGGDALVATAESALFNQLLDAGLSILRDVNCFRRPHLMQVNVFNLFTDIIASPAKYGLANVTDSSQGDYTVNPDTYLFWDGLHPTTRGHNLLAHTAAAVLTAGRKSEWAETAR